MTEEWATYGVVTDAHRSRSIRLKGNDYSQPGANFVTIVTQDRLCLLGNVVGEEMRFNEAGAMAQGICLDSTSQ